MPRPPLRTCTTLFCASSIIRVPANTAGESPANSAISRLLTALAHGYLDLSELTATYKLDGHGTTDPVSSKQYEQVVCVLDRLPVQRGEDIAHYEAAAVRRTAVLGILSQPVRLPDGQSPAPLGEAEALSVGEPHRLAQDAEVTALDRALLRERPRGTPGYVGRDGERRPAPPTRNQDAEYVSPRVDEWSSRETGVRRRVGLDVTFQPRSAPGADRASDGAYHPERGPGSLAARGAAHCQ